MEEIVGAGKSFVQQIQTVRTISGQQCDTTEADRTLYGIKHI